MNLLDEIRKNPFILAPMAGITDCAFRSFMREMGCGPVMTELVSANGLKFNSERTRRLMAFAPIQHPVGIQIFGEDPVALGEAAREVEEAGADFVDLNFGCPVPKVVKKGAGAAVLKDLVALRQILRQVRSSCQIPVTIKIRTGWDENHRNAVDVAQVAYDEGITWVAIHGRTRSAGYSGQADWDYIAQVQLKSSIPIIGNGDLVCPQLAIDRLKESGCDGVMIGRGCLKNPWIFQEALALWRGGQASPAERDFTHLFSRLWLHLEAHHSERAICLQAKKLAAWFSAGYPGSARFRKTLFAWSSYQDVFNCIEDFFGSLQGVVQADTSHEAFLMGGHG